MKPMFCLALTTLVTATLAWAGVGDITAESFEGWIARLFPGLLRRMLRQALDEAIGSLKAECERGRAKG